MPALIKCACVARIWRRSDFAGSSWVFCDIKALALYAYCTHVVELVKNPGNQSPSSPRRDP